MPRPFPTGPDRRVATAATTLAAAVLGAGPLAPSTASGAGPPRAAGAAARTTAISRLTRIARQRYDEEAYGIAVHTELRRIAGDGGLRSVLTTGSTAGLRAYVASRFRQVWYHQHASRMRIVRGAVTLVDVGVPFDVRPASRAIYDSRGRAAGRLDVSVQDIAGYIAFMRRNHGVGILVRGTGAQHVETSVPGAANAGLPNQGTATIAGRRYAVGSFSQFAYPHEPIRVWVLLRV